ILGPPGSVY
nr:Chain C, Ubiquitin-conjugating enzyme E2 E1 [synthetic construct]